MSNHSATKEVYIKGIPISGGVAIGKLYLLDRPDDSTLPDFPITDAEVDKEVQRYRRAVSSSFRDLNELYTASAKEGSFEAVTIIDSHMQILADPVITNCVEEKIRQMLRNAESVFRLVMSEYEQRFSDVKDIFKRILYYLIHPTEVKISNIPKNSIVFASEIFPSDAAEASHRHVLAFITKFGGDTSHTALIAKSKGIPFIAGVDSQALTEYILSDVIMNGETGEIIINPSSSTLQKYRLLEEAYKVQSTEKVKEHSQTRDGYKINVLANIETLDDFDTLEKCRVGGIGLVRSEFLFLHKDLYSFSETEQLAVYRKILNRAGDLPIIFRVFDFGGDKNAINAPIRDLEEPNPALGCRAIRYLLRHRDIFRAQIRAIVRANFEQKKSVWLLLPLITDIEELREAKKFIRNIENELIEEGVPLNTKMPIGSMIEVPSAVLICDLITKESDFLSIGTNDLMQYTLATDRCNPGMQDDCLPAHPSILRMIKIIVNHANIENRYVELCGEMASHPFFTACLLGIGIINFSCSPRYIPTLKKNISNISMKDAKKLTETIFGLSTSTEIYNLLKSQYQEFECLKL